MNSPLTGSPNGEHIAFASDEHGQWEIYTMKVSNRTITNLTMSPWNDFAPDWSPDGKRIAYASSRHDGQYQIYVMSASGFGKTRLTNNSGNDFAPNWSPDGQIAFVSDQHGEANIYVMSADRSRVIPWIVNGISPIWSPDGQRIAFVSSAGIYVRNINNEAIIPLITEHEQGGQLDEYSRRTHELVACVSAQ